MSMLDLFLLNVTHHFLPLKPKPLEAFLNKVEFWNSFLPKVLVNPRSLGVTYRSMGSSRHSKMILLANVSHIQTWHKILLQGFLSKTLIVLIYLIPLHLHVCWSCRLLQH